jgi:hypothetical protein
MYHIKEHVNPRYFDTRMIRWRVLLPALATAGSITMEREPELLSKVAMGSNPQGREARGFQLCRSFLT